MTDYRILVYLKKERTVCLSFDNPDYRDSALEAFAEAENTVYVADDHASYVFFTSDIAFIKTAETEV